MKVKLFSAILFLFFSINSFSQLLVENFDYAGGTNLSAHNWLIKSGEGTHPIIIESDNLSFSGYPSSGIGGSILIDNNGECVYSNLSNTQTSGIVYLSFLINASNATSAAGNYYIIGVGSSSAGTIGGRLFIKKFEGKFALGISKTTGIPSYTTFDYIFDTTYLIVIKYIINSGAANDDVLLFIFDNNIPSSEPIPTVTHPRETSNDPSNISVVYLRQESTTNIIKIDGIRVATSWSQAPLPVVLSSFTALRLNNAVHLIWSTATEINNYGFEIQRSEIRSQRSENLWEKVGFVEGTGNSNSPKEYSFVDDLSLNRNFTLQYRLKQIDNDGMFKYSDAVEVNLKVPEKCELYQNYPNPFNPATTITFNLPKAGNIKLIIYNVPGQVIKTLADEFKEAGTHSFSFDGSYYSSGLYFYHLETEEGTLARKMTLIK